LDGKITRKEIAMMGRRIAFALFMFGLVSYIYAQDISDYFPTAIGTKWTYTNSNGKLVDVVFVKNASVTNGARVYLFEQQSLGIGSTQILYGSFPNGIAEIANINIVGKYSENSEPFPIMLAPAGKKWTYTKLGEKYSCSSSKASVEFDGKNYPDCILVTAVSENPYTGTLTRKSYFARGIGLVYVTLQSVKEPEEGVFQKLVDFTPGR
jgi:hypothetical protein